MTPTQERIVRIATEWLGTKWFPHACRKGVGADCVTFALGVYKEADIVPYHVQLPRYSMDGGDHLTESALLAWLRNSPWFVPQAEPQVGSLITQNWGRVDHHVGIIISERQFIHCIPDYGVIKSERRDSTWLNRIQTNWLPVAGLEMQKSSELKEKILDAVFTPLSRPAA